MCNFCLQCFKSWRDTLETRKDQLKSKQMIGTPPYMGSEGWYVENPCLQIVAIFKTVISQVLLVNKSRLPLDLIRINLSSLNFDRQKRPTSFSASKQIILAKKWLKWPWQDTIKYISNNARLCWSARNNDKWLSCCYF